MNLPREGTTREQLLVKWRYRTFYYISQKSKSSEFRIEPCFLDRKYPWDVNKPVVNIFDFSNDMQVSTYGRVVDWSDLYSWDDAEKQIKHLNKLYRRGFYDRPYVSVDTLEQHKNALVSIERKIKKGLQDYPAFKGVDFCDVGANGIQIRGHHRDIKGYCYGKQVTIRYDFSNMKEVADEFIEMWKTLDTPEQVENYQRFLADGEKYGWD